MGTGATFAAWHSTAGIGIRSRPRLFPIISWGVNFDLIYLLTKPNGQSYGADMPAYFSFIPDQVADALKASPFGIPYDDFIGYFPASTHQPAGN